MKTRDAARRRANAGNLAPLMGGCTVLLLLASALLWHLRGSGAGNAIGGPFSLVADDGKRVTDQSFPGKYKLIYFGYTACRDVCPDTLNTLAAALGRLGGKSAQVQPLFITVDPAHDTPPVLRRYVQSFSPSLLGLTGAPAELRKVAGEYKVYVDNHADGVIDHGAVIYLMAPDGHFVAPIPAAATEMVMAQAIARGLD